MSRQSSNASTPVAGVHSGLLATLRGGAFEPWRGEYDRDEFPATSEVSSLTGPTGIGSYFDESSHATSVTQGISESEAGDTAFASGSAWPSNAATAGGGSVRSVGSLMHDIDQWSLVELERDGLAGAGGPRGKSFGGSGAPDSQVDQQDYGPVSLPPRPPYKGGVDVRGRSGGSKGTLPSVITVYTSDAGGYTIPRGDGRRKAALEQEDARKAVAKFFGVNYAGPAPQSSSSEGSSSGGAADAAGPAAPAAEAPPRPVHGIVDPTDTDEMKWRWALAVANVLAQGLAGFAGGFSCLYLLSRASRARAPQVLRPAEVVELGLHA
mmetsp:Transcript_102680/g.201362  ORF Transcript_102680/g.201362 Transcript_102680/m.201362 type:complete len:323 (-) Transcript_102680:176-1144(-)